jgi:folate-binding protein YgfZ
MSEVVEHLLFRELPLEATHRRLGASMSRHDDWVLPASYGETGAEYAVVREGGAGLIDLSTRGRITVSGSEAVQFLNGLITNDVKTLAPGRWMRAAFPNVQGRLLGAVRVINRDNSFLIDTEYATHAQVQKLLERFTLAGDFHVADISSETLMLSVQGARAFEIVGALLDQDNVHLEQDGVAVLKWREGDLTIIRATHTGEDGFDLFVSARDAAELWDALVAAGARPVGHDALEILRIEAGQPRYLVDMNETNVVLESGLDDAVSFTKGCYIGQEIIARIHWRGHVAKRLAGLSLDDEGEAIAHDLREAQVKTVDGKEIGRVTSAIRSPRLNRTIALGYLKYDYLAHGTPVRVLIGDEERAAQVVELPFVRGSWKQQTSSPTEAKE